MTGDSIHARMRAELSSRDLFEQAVQQVFRYMETVDDRPVYPARDAVQSLEQFDEPLPPQPQAGADVLAALETLGAPVTDGTMPVRHEVQIDRHQHQADQHKHQPERDMEFCRQFFHDPFT